MKPPLFRQSYAKVLLTDCPALLRIQMVKERKQSRAMQKGSLLDYLVFDQSDKYEIVDARYKTGPRAGQPCTDWQGREAQEQRDRILDEGLLPALETEIEALNDTAVAIQARIVKLADEMAGGHRRDILFQTHMTWTSARGVACEGTPDVVVLVHMPDLIKVCTIDVKHTGFLPKKRFNAQVFAMGWDVQGAAYREGSAKWAESEHAAYAFHLEHVILATSSLEAGLPPVARRLSPAYMAGGLKRWEKAQGIWQECLASDSWPSYEETDAEPSHFYVHTEIEAIDHTQAFPEEEP